MRPSVFSRRLAVFAAVARLAAAATTVSSTVLIIAADDESVAAASPGLDGYGIPWAKVTIPRGGRQLPELNSTAAAGNYGGIILVGSVSYETNGTYSSAITTDQWNQLYSYQSAFKVRMVRLAEYPGPQFGTTALGECCNAEEQLISINSSVAFAGANLKTNAPVSTLGLWHYPAQITDAGVATAFAAFSTNSKFPTESVAAVINDIDGREQMVWFVDFAPDWSLTSNYLQHSYIHWVTRSLFVGKRKVYLSTQVDDVHLATEMYLPANTTFRLRPEDLDAHVAWQKDINGRLPAGSDYWMELGHNGNGDIESAVTLESQAGSTVECRPDAAVDYISPPDTPLEWAKPPGSGTDLWPSSFQSYNWSKDCASLDPLARWFLDTNNLNAFGHVSHTFSHEELNNATYHDATREISFNQAWLAQMGISQAARFSPHGLIPPAITGLHNADAINAWTANGIKYVVGDNTRPVLVNRQNQFWPLASTVDANGATGIYIIPRWATTIYYNCWSSDCTVQEWKDTSGGSGTFDDLLKDARTTNAAHLLGLKPDPYMFHQANLRQTDMPVIAVGSETKKMSLIMSWVETVAQEMVRLTNWPLVSLKHDDTAACFINRMTLDGCKPRADYTYSDDGTSITAITVSAQDTSCSVPVPVTIPGGRTVSASSGSPKSDNVGNEPPIIWVTLSGSPVTLTLSSPRHVARSSGGVCGDAFPVLCHFFFVV
ncbi:uncharacterized protein MAM_08097 [Metarhizium album ARSEF 1941]|uniref:Extracellular serine-rich protein n=1 Tax=Metarhizium album (strain ARSEF 1941) TaxID=1081103 RepID=A0A0B2WJC7_METAS|nr:uncharacterized protein MAM_08097 [Metarhizium album ARSEF 1941]KHN94023.1 hypothetical protein MAM_08097 [Metarhizium album ARSEF 1941]